MDNKFRAVLFDFDYTLADSSRGVIKCINYALGNMGFNAPSEDAACRTIGLSLHNTFRQICGEEHMERAPEFSRLFVEHADRVMNDHTFLFSSVVETMLILRKKGIKLGIISSKFRYRIEAILEKAKLREAFDIIVGGEDVENQKPCPEGIGKAVRFLGLRENDILYIGDSITYAETAKNAGVTFAASLTGVTKKEEFEKYEVYEYITDICELVNII